MNSFLYILSILWVDSDVFIFSQRSFLTAHYVFHLQRSLFFAELSDLSHMFSVFEIQNWVQFVSKNLRWITTMKEIQQFCFFQQSFFLMTVHAVLIWHVMLLFFILFSAWKTTEFRWKFRKKIYVSIFTVINKVVL